MIRYSLIEVIEDILEVREDVLEVREEIDNAARVLIGMKTQCTVKNKLMKHYHT